MGKFLPLPKPLLAMLATLFAAATTLYSVLWMYNVRQQPRVELGFDNQYVASEHCHLVTKVVSDSPAEKAGLRTGDRILGINRRLLRDAYSLSDVWARRQPCDSVELIIKLANVSAPFVIKGVFRARRDTSKEGGITQHLRADIANTYPVAFLVVGLAVLFLRLEDPNAWLLALMFGGFIAVPDVQMGLGSSWRGFTIAYRTIFYSMGAPLSEAGIAEKTNLQSSILWHLVLPEIWRPFLGVEPRSHGLCDDAIAFLASHVGEHRTHEPAYLLPPSIP